MALLQGGQVRRAPAPLRLHKMFADSMVLQAEAPKVYGFAPAGTKVTVAVVGNATAVAAQVAGEDGTWSALLPEQPASDPAAPRGFEISVNGSCPGCHLTLSDVLFGDVWICRSAFAFVFCLLAGALIRYSPSRLFDLLAVTSPSPFSRVGCICIYHRRPGVPSRPRNSDPMGVDITALCLCVFLSGQSNMEFSVAEMFDRDRVRA